MSEAATNSEDVMDMLSTGDDIDMTQEEESLLLDVKSSLTKKSMDTSDPMARKPIVFDLNDSQEDSDVNDVNESSRDKFRTERTTINLVANKGSVERQLPDSLDEIAVDLGQRLKNKNLRKRRNRQNRRNFGFQSDRQLPQMNANLSSRLNRFNQNSDLRQFMSSTTARRHAINQSAVLQNQIMNLSQMVSNMNPLMNWQMDLGILDPNQLLVNALLAQTQTTSLANRLQVLRPSLTTGPNFVPLNASKANAPKDDIQITIINNNNNRPLNTTKTSTKSQIRCLVPKDISDQEIEEIDLIPRSKSLDSSHLFHEMAVSVKHNANTSGGDVFVDALAEAEVGVDNEYLAKLEEQERKRRELKQLKEQRRLEMADERLQSALDLKNKISARKTYY
ncbi:unnamed protein product [Oppiella nova]|uniref:Uncharacterized protein n=1 Tax=Oppiella nova TaxID=334625 RepID=A0A7R9QMQ4_9ACAR|nr:unnamed protein product [Oppiella nova]CAG2168978.1 unnamed protein product [Oppiella nova]